MILTTSVILPAHWACALVNDDWTGLSRDDERLCAAAHDCLLDEGWVVVDVERDEDGEPLASWFSWNYGIYLPRVRGIAPPEGGELQSYIAHQDGARIYHHAFKLKG